MLILSSISDCKLESAEGFKLGFIVPFAKSNRFVYRQRRSFMLMQVFVLLVLTSGVLCAGSQKASITSRSGKSTKTAPSWN